MRGEFNLPEFPQFAWNDYFWTTSVKLPAWSGYQIRNGPYGSVSEEGRSDGTVQLVFAPEGRHEKPLSDHEFVLVEWLIENQAAVHDATLKKLFEEYPAIRAEALGWSHEEGAEKALPEVWSPQQLKVLVGISSINMHQIEQDGKPFIGVELGCTGDAEHGVGILLHGSRPLEIGGADTACYGLRRNIWEISRGSVDRKPKASAQDLRKSSTGVLSAQNRRPSTT